MGLKRKIQGITLIEVVVAIIVFGTGVLVVLSLLTQNVTRMNDLNQKTTAVNLAKEGIDMVLHLRDSNLERGSYWYCAEVAAPCTQYFLQDVDQSTRIIDWNVDGLYYLTSYNDTGNSRIYYHTGLMSAATGTAYTGFWYNHDSSGGERTVYRRWLVFKPMSEYPTHTGKILQLESHVDYSRSGGETKRIILETLIGDIR